MIEDGGLKQGSSDKDGEKLTNLRNILMVGRT